MNKRDEILEGLSEIKLLGSPAMGAMKIMGDPNVSNAEVVKVLSLDPALTTNTLRFANSAYFGCSQKIHTVQEAIVRLGMKTISRMLFLSSSSELAARPVGGYDLAPGSLWKSMISSAIGTDVLAKHLMVKAPGYTFTSGLIHNIGKLVLGTYLEIDAKPICELAVNEGISFDEAEEHVLGINHAEVGAELLRQWNLPEAMAEVVRWHHTPAQCPGDSLAVDLVHTSDAITMMAGCGLGIDGLQYKICPLSVERLGVTGEIIEHVLCDLPDEIEKLSQLMT